MLFSIGLYLSLALKPDQEPQRLAFLPKGLVNKVHWYMPSEAALSEHRPSGISKVPDGLVKPLYGVITIDSKKFFAIIDDPDGQSTKLCVDTNGNGDLTDDPAVDWAPMKKNPAHPSLGVTYSGKAQITLDIDGKPTLATIGVYHFINSDPSIQAPKKFYYYPDFGFGGVLKFDKNTYSVLAFSRTGAMDVKPGDPSYDMLVAIDKNDDGNYSELETYDADKPFNVKGNVYEAGDKVGQGIFALRKSAIRVAEVHDSTGDFRLGKRAPNFEAKTITGESLSFPGSYKGKVVMLDFWATWCRPCVADLPYVSDVYHKFHAQGFEVLGISLDEASYIPKIRSYSKSEGFDWKHIVAGNDWKVGLAAKFGIAATGIPFALLVDGDTGVILALNPSLHSSLLEKTIQAALEKKGLLKGGGK